MGKHHDSAETQARDMTAATLLTFITKANLQRQTLDRLDKEQRDALTAAARNHERRQSRWLRPERDLTA
jgi:hypothetical protein